MRVQQTIFSIVAIGAVACTGMRAEAQLPAIDADTHASGFSLPLRAVQDPANPDVQFIAQQRGRIIALVDGVRQSPDFLDLTGIVSRTGNERGLLGLAFPPDPTDNRFYVNYTLDSTGATRVVRYERDPNNPLLADPNSAEVLLTVGQPFSNHNGGHMLFGPDGMLYIGLGDGGNAGDPGHRSQNPNTLLGKMLRIDVSPASGFDVPPDNPFVDNQPVNALDEIWAFGVRNPWRWSFDNPRLGGTGAMLLADVGQNAWEEVNYQPAGVGGINWGWRNREGMHDFNNSLPPAYTPLEDPFFEYSHAQGRSVTGGYVYRGKALGSPYYGRYFFADFVFARVWSFQLTVDGKGNATASDLVEHTGDLGSVGNISSFGEDAEGELFMTSFNGNVFRIVPSETTTLTDVQPVFGTVISGDLASIERSDDVYYELRSIFGFSATEPNVVEFEVTAQTDASNPTLLDVVIEGRLNNSGGVGQLKLFNVNAGKFRQKGTYSIGLEEEIFRFPARSNPERFVNAQGEVRMRTRQVVIATFSAEGFRSFTDQVAIVVRD